MWEIWGFRVGTVPTDDFMFRNLNQYYLRTSWFEFHFQSILGLWVESLVREGGGGAPLTLKKMWTELSKVRNVWDGKCPVGKVLEPNRVLGFRFFLCGCSD